MNSVPIYVSIVFILTVITTFGFIYFAVKATHTSNKLTVIVSLTLITWLAFTAILSLNEFFLVVDVMPPRFMMLLGIPLIGIIILFSKEKSRTFIKQIPITTLNYLHIIRVPVEMVLWWLFLAGTIPQLMTFEGGNLDILSGITAPFVAIFFVGMKNKRRIVAIIWNLITLGLLFNIIIHAVLSLPLPFQQLAFDTPNIALLYFPYIWLPAFVVPTVMFAHFASLMKLWDKSDDIV